MKNKIKHLWLRILVLQRFTGPFLVLRASDDVSTEPPLIGPDSKDGSVFALFNLSFHFQYYSLHTNTYQNVKKMSF